MSDPERVSVTRRIAAPAHTIFGLSPTLTGTSASTGPACSSRPNAAAGERVGDTFEMDMDREPLGDIPLGRYRVQNMVTQIAPDAELEWSVGRWNMVPTATCTAASCPRWTTVRPMYAL